MTYKQELDKLIDDVDALYLRSSAMREAAKKAEKEAWGDVIIMLTNAFNILSRIDLALDAAQKAVIVKP